LLTLHNLMTQELLSTNDCGKYRAVQNYIIDAKGIVVFTPPAPKKVAQCIKDLFSWIKNFPDIHPVVRSAIFHHQFVTIHPFTDGNGRVARAAGQWLLFEKGYDPLHTLGLDDFFAADRKRYYEMIQQARELDGDYTYWVDYIAEGLVDSVQNVANRIRMARRSQKVSKTPVTPKQEELLRLIDEYGVLGSAQICEYMKINRARVNQLIAPLVRAGVVIKEGTTRGVKYSLA
jgi:Fic family protein